MIKTGVASFIGCLLSLSDSLKIGADSNVILPCAIVTLNLRILGWAISIIDVRPDAQTNQPQPHNVGPFVADAASKHRFTVHPGERPG